MIIEYAKVRQDVIEPSRANPSDAGLDVFYSPKTLDWSGLTINPGECAIIPTGLRFGVPHGFMLEVKNRSSVAAKRNLLVGACVVDPGYDGELFVNLHNVGKLEQFIAAGDKIAQVVMIPVVHFRACESEFGDLYNWEQIAISDRGEGGLGSTDE
jgi:dUTP pyrophosphatase